jgi:predicted dehydrogenase
MNRREFLSTAAVAGAAMAGTGLTALPRASRGRTVSPSEKLNIAMIGVAGRAKAHYGVMGKENIVALCDVDETHLDAAAQNYPKAGKYIDWRKCLDQKDIDAVVICTTDFTHALVANWALNRGLHVYCEKPLAISVEEARVIRANYLKNKGKIATQVGTQRHEIENFNRVRELVMDGAIGTLKSACAWGNRKIPKPGYFPAEGQPPKGLHYDLWLGPAPEHPYNPAYFHGCLAWNPFWDFGTGQVGDMGSHTMDLAWNAIDGDLPTGISSRGEKFNQDVTPVELETHFSLPANSWRPEIECSWYQGGAMPKSPADYIDLSKIGHGAMFKGSEGSIVCDFGSRILVPTGKAANMTYYKPRPEAQLIPKMGVFQSEWVNACKGNLKTSCNFDYAGKMIEMMLLGLVAYRVGTHIAYDGKIGRVTNCDPANELLSRKYRAGWTLNG